MSLFDSLKYPISDPPTVEEFKAVPLPLFHQWAVKSEWSHQPDYKVLPDYAYMIRIYEDFRDKWQPDSHSDLILLRKMILAYEPV